MNMLPPTRKRRAKTDGRQKIVDNPKTKNFPASSIKEKRTESKGSLSQGPATPSSITQKTSNTASKSKKETNKSSKKKKKSPGAEKDTGKAKAKTSLKETPTTVPLGLSKSSTVNAKTDPKTQTASHTIKVSKAQKSQTFICKTTTKKEFAKSPGSGAKTVQNNVADYHATQGKRAKPTKQDCKAAAGAKKPKSVTSQCTASKKTMDKKKMPA